MKVLYHCSLLLFTAVTLIHAENADPHKPIRLKCRSDLTLTPEALEAGASHPEDFGCYVSCFLQNIDIMDDKGVFDPAIATQSVAEELREESKPEIYACHEMRKNEPVDDLCKTAFGMINCLKERAPKLYEMLGIFRAPGN
uniref:Odorant binding protein 1 n=1 Tax=Macrocentrus cingulum TaxID=535359 RepID=X2D9T4_9HYME|nr:odorant binding protein 1 [Macrocentrus cingulum]